MNDIQVLQPVTGSIDHAMVDRVQKFLHLDNLPMERLSADDKAWMERYLSDLFASQLMVFRESVEKGEPDSIRRGHFQSEYKALKRAYEIEQGLKCRECRGDVDPEELEAHEEPHNAICQSCSDTLNQGQALDYFADGKR